MVWIISGAPKVQEVALGSDKMNEAANVYMTEAEAFAALQEVCEHYTKIGNRSTGHIQCADCRKPFN